MTNKRLGASTTSCQNRFSTCFNFRTNTARVMAIFVGAIDAAAFQSVHPNCSANCFPLPKMTRYNDSAFASCVGFPSVRQVRGPVVSEFVILRLEFSIVVDFQKSVRPICLPHFLGQALHVHYAFIFGKKTRDTSRSKTGVLQAENQRMITPKCLSPKPRDRKIKMKRQ